MTIYARVAEGRVLEIFEPIFDEAGREIPIESRFHPDFVAELQQYDPANPPAPPPAPTHAEMVEQAKASMRVQRPPILSRLDGLQTSALVKGNSELATAIESAKQGLRDITDIDLSACVALDDMSLAVNARYLQLAASLPADVQVAFSGVVS